MQTKEVAKLSAELHVCVFGLSQVELFKQPLGVTVVLYHPSNTHSPALCCCRRMAAVPGSCEADDLAIEVGVVDVMEVRRLG